VVNFGTHDDMVLDHYLFERRSEFVDWMEIVEKIEKKL
jgi:hypothetical protein